MTRRITINGISFDTTARPGALTLAAVRLSIEPDDAFHDVVYAVVWKSLSRPSRYSVRRCDHVTTLPGVRWLRNPRRADGVGIVAAGTNYYELGLHKKDPNRPCLRPVGAVKVHRDNNRDGRYDLEPPLVDGYGFNWHTHTLKRHNPSTVGAWGEGCTVFARRADLADILDLARGHFDHYRDPIMVHTIDAWRTS